MDRLDAWLTAPGGAVTAVVATWLAVTLLTAGALRWCDRRLTGLIPAALDGVLRALAPGIAGRALRAAVGLGATGAALVAGAVLSGTNAVAAGAPAATPAGQVARQVPPVSLRLAARTDVPRAAAPAAPGIGAVSTGRTPPPDLWPLTAPAGRGRSPGDPREVVVHRGDTLWAIAARHLPADATNSDIDAAWQTWFRANRAVIGSDPNLLLPGQLLHAPG